MGSFGYEIVSSPITDIDPNAEVKRAMNEINKAKADAEAKYMAGQGISRQRQAIIAGLRDSVNSFKSEVQDVDAKSVMDLMVVTQYFDMMKDIGAQSKSNAVFMNHSPAALQGLTQSVQAGFLSSAPIAGDMARR